jgi:4'-phosphopantetheinyl transferase
LNLRTVSAAWARVADVSANDLAAERRQLAPALRQRLDELHHDDDRRRMLAARALARAAVVGHVGLRPDSAVEFRQCCPRCGGPHGKPEVLVNGRLGPQVSWSHAGNWVVAVAADSAVGVDLEPVDALAGRDADATRIAPVERDRLVRWVRTEAVLKATGHGLNVDPRLVEVSGADRAAELIRWSGPGRHPRLGLTDLDISADVVAALAVQGTRGFRVRHVEFRENNRPVSASLRVRQIR